MHKKFVDQWCGTFDRLYDAVGEEAALAMTRDILDPSDWELVNTRLPDYLKEQRQNDQRHSY